MQQERQRSPEDLSPRNRWLARTGPVHAVAMAVAVVGALFNIVGLNVYPVEAFVLRSTFLFVASVVAFVLYPARKNDRGHVTTFDLLLIGASASAYLYTILNYEGLMDRAGVLWITPDLVVGAVLILTILELARRTMGPALPILSLVLLGYALWGPYFPGIFGHPGFAVDRVISYVYSLDAIFGTPVGVCVTYVFVFVLFGALMEATGGGRVLMDLAVSLTGRSRGGTAKIAIVGSSFFGTLNGSPVANVMATGTFTIPAMKKTGYQPAFAGAVEAAASTGGQILPPIMGASVFIMMDILGSDYLSIAKAAIIPAILYYVGVFWMVDLEARRTGVRGLSEDEIPKARDVLKKGGYLLLPIAVLLYALLVAQVSPLRAGLIGALSCIVLGAIKKESRLGPKAIASALFVTMRSSIMVVAACALAGVVVGVLGLTGLGLNIANIILSYSMGLLPLALLLATVVAIILGLGMPTTASYIICAAIIAPGLIEMGVTAMGAHLFVLYFANMSNITPPVALACYGASSIAQANPLDVSVKAFKLGLVGFLIPFAWVYGPELIMDGPPLSVAYTAATALIGVLALGVSLQGIVGTKVLGWPARLCAASVAVLLVVPGVSTDALAIAVLVVLAMLGLWRNSRLPPSAADTS